MMLKLSSMKDERKSGLSLTSAERRLASDALDGSGDSSRLRLREARSPVTPSHVRTPHTLHTTLLTSHHSKSYCGRISLFAEISMHKPTISHVITHSKL